MRVGDHYGSSKRQIILLSGSGMHSGAMQPKQTSDIAFFVSGSIGSKGTSTRGTAVFGGDLHVSGSIHGITSAHILATDDPKLSNARVLTAGDGISISTATPRQITISSTGLVSRTKSFYDVTGSHSANSVLDFHGVNFSNSSYDFNKIDIYVNGQSMRSGSSHDYVLQPTGSLRFSFDLEEGDVIQTILY